MDRNSVSRLLLIAGALLAIYFFMGRKSTSEPIHPLADTYLNAPDFAPDRIDDKGYPAPPPGEACSIKSDKYEAELSGRGAAIVHFKLLEPRFAQSAAADLSTTPDHERWRSLRSLFRAQGADDQFRYDRFSWKAKQVDPKTCEFTYEDPGLVSVKKVYRSGAGPYELDVETTIANLADAAKKHRFSTGVYAWRTNAELSGSLGRVSPFLSDVACASTAQVTRKAPEDFKGAWHNEGGVDRFVTVSNYYFAQAIFPEPGKAVECALLTEAWPTAAGQSAGDDAAAKSYRALMHYPPRDLEPKASVTYKQTVFYGPKEREVLAHVAGGKRGAGDLIDLGFFTVVAKVLVNFLNILHTKVTFGNWGIAIVLLTVCVRLVLFPLTWKSIQSTVAMRRLKPELDALKEKFKDDQQAFGLAQMELWRKRKINPLGGCLPQLVQMPVWFAMYRTLQTAAEMYHVKFLWFQDLSAPDRFYILPLLLGGFMILQQRIVPMQGVDPVQAKMMMWLMPVIFTVMMLFLPAALGIYMLTNSILGIVQQLAIEKFAPAPVEIGVKEVTAAR
jgi:YidC/Oxa1 family membrane protein insertase